MAKFRACVSVGLMGCNREIEFEVDDEDLEGLSDDQRDYYLFQEAEEVINGHGTVEIWYEEDN